MRFNQLLILASCCAALVCHAQEGNIPPQTLEGAPPLAMQPSSGVPPQMDVLPQGEVMLQTDAAPVGVQQTGVPPAVEAPLPAGEPVVAAAPVTAPASKPPSTSVLAKEKNCFACHNRTDKGVGPSFAEISARYTEADIERLVDSTRNGSKGVWGSIPKNPDTKISEEDARQIVQWILTLPKANISNTTLTQASSAQEAVSQ